MSASVMLPRKSREICKIILCFWGKGRGNGKRLLLRLSFKGVSPASSLKPRENQNDWGWNEYVWLVLCCTDKSSPALLAAPPILTPCSLHPSSSQRQHPASGRRRSVRRKEQSQHHPCRGFGFWKPSGTALIAGWGHSCAYPPVETFPSQPPYLKGGRHRGSWRTRWWSQLPTQRASAGSTVSPYLGVELRCLQEALALPLQLQQSHCPRKLINQVLLFCI